MAFDNTTRREDSGIANSQIEEMFMLIATAEQEQKYMGMLENGYTGPATSYASSIVKRMFYKWFEDSVRRGDDPILQNDLMSNKGKLKHETAVPNGVRK